ncbi:MAG TPA: hypothetical protein PKU77_01875 [Ferruginibacter sp.]|nr:hypothetical protein [Ferruginibacter sp.]
MSKNFGNKWLRWALINLVLVALYGTLMRYKIAFNFPYLEQKNLLHAHSHFAFAGWISHVLYTGLAIIIGSVISEQKIKKYNLLILANLLCAFGMLISFTMLGYKAISIVFSTSSIVVAILFCISFIKDAKSMSSTHPSKCWAITGLLLNILSSAGPFFLAYMLMSKNINSQSYLGSVYYYLHFQYSGWFFFGAMAIAASMLPATILLKKYFWGFTITVIPTLFLSLLWAKLPGWLYVVTVSAAIVQLITWVMLLIKTIPVVKNLQPGYPKWINVFFYAAAFALTLKFLLQAISVVPSLSQLVFGIRSIVIAYLHLILLGVYSLFIIGYAFAKGSLKISKFACIAAFIFLCGVFLNELLLGIQGFAAFFYIPVSHINEMLFAIAVMLLLGSVLLASSQIKRKLD